MREPTAKMSSAGATSAPHTNVDGEVDAGTVTVFEASGESWTKTAELRASNLGTGHRFGAMPHSAAKKARTNRLGRADATTRREHPRTNYVWGRVRAARKLRRCRESTRLA